MRKTITSWGANNQQKNQHRNDEGVKRIGRAQDHGELEQRYTDHGHADGGSQSNQDPEAVRCRRDAADEAGNSPRSAECQKENLLAMRQRG